MLIWHSPMKPSYKSAIDYQDTTLPLLQEEWNYTSKDYSTNHSTTGKIIKATAIEILECKNLKQSRFGFRIAVHENGFWNLDNFGSLRDVLLIFKGYSARRVLLRK